MGVMVRDGGVDNRDEGNWTLDERLDPRLLNFGHYRYDQGRTSFYCAVGEHLEHELADIQLAVADPRRFTVLYERYFSEIFRFLLRRCPDRDRCNDLVQDTFLKAMLALPKYQSRGLPFRAWLYRIALNELRMHWRRRKEVLIDMSYAEVRGLSEEVGLPMENDELRRLASAMGKLDEERAHLIHLRYMDGMSFSEIVQVLGIGEDAAKMRTHRVLATLRTYLGPRA